MSRVTTDRLPSSRLCNWIFGITAAAAGGVLGLSILRLIYEGVWPKLLWLGAPSVALVISIIFALLGWLAWRKLVEKLTSGRSPGTGSGDDHTAPPTDPDCQSYALAAVPFLPLFLNLTVLFDTGISFIDSRFVAFAALWLSLLFLARLLAAAGRWIWLGILFTTLFMLPLYLLTTSHTVGSADTFEFQVTVPQLGIAHPTGYPLYIMLSKPFTWLPISSIAWRINLATMTFGLLALSLFYLLIYRLTRMPLTAVAASVILGLTPTFWSQSIQAEVYSLNALIVVLCLLLMREIGQWTIFGRQPENSHIPTNRRLHLMIILAFFLGLGLTNHLTVIILFPAALLTIFFAYREGSFSQSTWGWGKTILAVGLAFLAPLILYAYLPIRWSALNPDPMGFGRFLDWIIGGRFQGALQLTSWLQDVERYTIVGRLFGAEWPWLWFIPVVIFGLINLFMSSWRFALILFISWLGYVFYGLNYIVPDLAVFLLPSVIIMTAWWGLGLSGLMILLLRTVNRGFRRSDLKSNIWPRGSFLAFLLLLILLIPLLLFAVKQTWPSVDASPDDGRTQWGNAVLDQPLIPGATILADSHNFPPLYYLQQIEGLREDLDIVLLPDEAAYRAALVEGLQGGSAVYLARFLPGLEGSYHLRSAGPLTEVSQDTLNTLPDGAASANLQFGPVRLLGYSLEPVSPINSMESSVTLFWQSDKKLDNIEHVYVRWSGPEGSSSPVGQHPANNYYPTSAWQPGEIVADFHSLPSPGSIAGDEIELQVALGPPFAEQSELDWQTLTTINSSQLSFNPEIQKQFFRLGPVQLEGISYQDRVRPGEDITIQIFGSAAQPERLIITALSEEAGPQSAAEIFVDPDADGRFFSTILLPVGHEDGAFELVISHPTEPNICGWLRPASDDCSLGYLTVDSAQLEESAVNFDDQIALLAIDVSPTLLVPGQLVDVQLQWLAQSEMSDDYTIFIQILDEADKIVGQIDSWPLQGTYPTSSWKSGEIIDDSFQVRLDSDLAPGPYKLHMGWYLLETLRRLPVLNESGQEVDDKVEIPGLSVPEN